MESIDTLKARLSAEALAQHAIIVDAEKGMKDADDERREAERAGDGNAASYWNTEYLKSREANDAARREIETLGEKEAREDLALAELFITNPRLAARIARNLNK